MTFSPDLARERIRFIEARIEDEGNYPSLIAPIGVFEDEIAWWTRQLVAHDDTPVNADILAIESSVASLQTEIAGMGRDAWLLTAQVNLDNVLSAVRKHFEEMEDV